MTVSVSKKEKIGKQTIIHSKQKINFSLQIWKLQLLEDVKICVHLMKLNCMYFINFHSTFEIFNKF